MYDGKNKENAPLMHCANTSTTLLKLNASIGDPLIAIIPANAGITPSIKSSVSFTAPVTASVSPFDTASTVNITQAHPAHSAACFVPSVFMPNDIIRLTVSITASTVQKPERASPAADVKSDITARITRSGVISEKLSADGVTPTDSISFFVSPSTESHTLA